MLNLLHKRPEDNIFRGQGYIDCCHPSFPWDDSVLGMTPEGSRMIARLIVPYPRLMMGYPYEESSPLISFRHCAGWLVHAFTASGAFVGLLALVAINQHNMLLALWLMLVAILIDATDGVCARAIKVKEVLPQVNGELLDNMVDFFNYTLVPCFFLLMTDLLPEHYRALGVLMITFASAYQFAQVDAKTLDCFFKGFPSYWNIAVFYLFFWQTDSMTNMGIILVLAVLSFVPIKYVYPSRLEHLTHHRSLRFCMLFLTVIWGIANTILLWLYPKTNHFLVAISIGYILLYLGVSLYRTWTPLSNLARSSS